MTFEVASSAGYLLAALDLLRRTRRAPPGARLLLAALAGWLVVLAAGSATFHQDPGGRLGHVAHDVGIVGTLSLLAASGSGGTPRRVLVLHAAPPLLAAGVGLVGWSTVALQALAAGWLAAAQLRHRARPAGLVPLSAAAAAELAGRTVAAGVSGLLHASWHLLTALAVQRWARRTLLRPVAARLDGKHLRTRRVVAGDA